MSKPDLATYGTKLHDAGIAGQVADFNPATIESKVNGNATSINFGVAVARGTTDDTCKPQLLDGDKLIGISVRSPIQVADPATNEIVYKQNDTVAIMREGYIWAVAFENTVRGDGVIAVTAQTGKLGSTTGGAAGAGRIALPGALWETSTTAGQVGLIRINN